MGIALFIRRLTRAPARTRRLILTIFVGATLLGDLLFGIEGALCGPVAAILPAYFLLNYHAEAKKSYSLFVTAAPLSEAASYREASRPTLAALTEKLARHGYRLEAFGVDSDGNSAARLDESAPLCGPVMWLRMAGVAAERGGVRLRLPDGKGVGELDVTDGPSGRYQELALYTIVAAGELFHGTTFRDSFSSLSAETTEWLRPQLPDRPHSLKS